MLNDCLFRAFLFLFHCSLCLAIVSRLSLKSDERALLAFKSAIQTNPDDNILSTNWSTATSFCEWLGVSCSPRHGRVTALNLPNMGLAGSLTPYLGNLSFLVALDISNNSFSGELPSELEIGSLFQLQLLNLTDNQLTGSIPSSVFNISSLKAISLASNNLSGSLPQDLCYNLPMLEELVIPFNKLSGQIPTSIERCAMLRVLKLRVNEIGGSIPSELGNVTMLEVFDIGHNYLQGEIPWEVGNLNNLVEFAVNDNNLTGSIPSTVFNISSLQEFIFSNNSMYGTLPMDLCRRLPSLEHMFLYGNAFAGSIPRDMGNCTMLKQLRFGLNRFTGNIPAEIGNLQYLELLTLPVNSLSGPIPPSIFNCSTLKVLSLAGNGLSGNLPSDLGLHLPVLIHLLLGGNQIDGIIPKSISNASSLVLLDLAENLLTGAIPITFGNLEFLEYIGLDSNHLTHDQSSVPELNFMTSLTNCRHMRVLLINGNNLTGVFPPSIGNLSTTFENIDASNCNIFGKMPDGLGNLSNLISLSLTNNDLTGPIPQTFRRLTSMQRLNLSYNMLQESIPSDLCEMRSLGELSLSGNKLSGSIPACFGNVSSLRILLLDNNNLTSTIPSTLWNLRDMLSLNLSSNSLRGNLPAEISKFSLLTYLDLSNNQFIGGVQSEIGALQQLTHLSLAHNEFQGPIPESFGRILSLEFLDLSFNNISGVIPKSLEELSYLKYLNMSFNKLEGEIPSRGPFANFTSQSFMNNSGLCGASQLNVPPCHRQRSMKAGVLVLKYILPATASAILVLVSVLLLLRRRRKKTKEKAPEATLFPKETYRRISYYELKRATNQFDQSSLLGKGSFSSVYKGILVDGVVVAVKVFNLQQEGAFKSFDSECEVIRKIRHRNLIKIIGSCSNPDYKALVMQYMSNGSLDLLLYSDKPCLSILQRIDILLDVANALEYLHYGQSAPIVHCDVKPSNVLLDENLLAHLGDFGISKLLGETISLIQTKTLATVGYMAPEYGSQGIVSTSGDVYSYGIMMMETFTRKKPTDEMFNGEMSLKQWVLNSLSAGIIVKTIDNNLITTEGEQFAAKEECLSSIMSLALQCCEESPDMRIEMKEVLRRMQQIQRHVSEIMLKFSAR
ncbi:hypothetical protein K2173_001487 [Erythroxylum novogranatense]|uniref:non-specific serine/threonine protein kinase n=1 Tax=Erythroxylum novogranatense TaxID=1862640 RepID=A0AAV8T536_9ROSI|nr:hypothetical protein K2173_001487 [Erythroxylum novogranatense]